MEYSPLHDNRVLEIFTRRQFCHLPPGHLVIIIGSQVKTEAFYDEPDSIQQHKSKKKEAELEVLECPAYEQAKEDLKLEECPTYEQAKKELELRECPAYVEKRKDDIKQEECPAYYGHA